MSSPIFVETCSPSIGSRVFAYYFSKRLCENLFLFARQRDSGLGGKIKSGEMPEWDQDILETERMDRADKNVPAFVNSQPLQAALEFACALRVVRDTRYAARWLHIFSQNPGHLYC